MNENMAVQEKANPDALRELAIWLEGVKHGRGGSLEPLGTIVLDELWKAIRELRDIRRSNQHKELSDPEQPVFLRKIMD